MAIKPVFYFERSFLIRQKPGLSKKFPEKSNYGDKPGFLFKGYVVMQLLI